MVERKVVIGLSIVKKWFEKSVNTNHTQKMHAGFYQILKSFYQVLATFLKTFILLDTVYLLVVVVS